MTAATTGINETNAKKSGLEVDTVTVSYTHLVFAQEHVDALLLEYDDARSGGFAPLAKVSPDKKVVLGLITTCLLYTSRCV